MSCYLMGEEFQFCNMKNVLEAGYTVNRLYTTEMHTCTTHREAWIYICEGTWNSCLAGSGLSQECWNVSRDNPDPAFSCHYFLYLHCIRY